MFIFLYRCVIKSLCSPNVEFQKVNPTTQIALFSFCVNECPEEKKLIWNIYFGRNTTNFTCLIHFRNETHWKFEVIYQFEGINSSSALNFEINPPPSNGSCEINPRNGTIKTLFKVTCSDWKIKEYSLFTRTKQIIAFSPIPSFEVRLPIGNSLDLFVEIRDYLNAITEFHLSPVTVVKEEINLSKELLSNENQNTIGQMIRLITDEWNQIDISNEIPLTSIFISPLISQVNIRNNQSTRSEFIKEINRLADLRESFIKLIPEMTVVSVNSLKLQSLSLVQLTDATNQLTRTSLQIVSQKFFQLTEELQFWLEKMTFEDVQMIVTQLLQCASNVVTAANGPLQKRMEILDEWVFDFQKELADSLNEKLNQIIFILTSSLNLHLNLGQNYSIQTPQVFLSLQTISLQSLLNRMNLSSSNLNRNQTVSFRVRSSLFFSFEFLLIFSRSLIESNTNLSRSLSISILDEKGNEIPFKTTS